MVMQNENQSTHRSRCQKRKERQTAEDARQRFGEPSQLKTKATDDLSNQVITFKTKQGTGRKRQTYAEAELKMVLSLIGAHAIT